MTRLTNEECVRRYAAASAAHDLEALPTLRHPEWMVSWPQSGEIVHGSQAFAEIITNYPGGAPAVEVTRIIGAEDQWVVTPANTAIRVAGSGDFWWS
ncbi:MAG TPA: nuclear transport factor 2 family protein, partial [Patescibacteria group bacterium]|nr:nuclear transport factor 2 family protein [Patescibacteria group bacterium]